MLELDHRAKDIENGSSPVTDAQKEYAKFLARSKDTSYEFDIAIEIHNNFTQKEILEALILSDCPEESIETAFKVPIKSVKIYKDLFYDTSVFKTKLAIIVYLEEYVKNCKSKVSTSQKEWAKELKIRAVNLGYEYILYSYANIVPKTNKQQELVERMFMASAYKAMNANYFSVTSDITKQAVKHAELMLKAFEMLTKIRDGKADVGQDLIKVITKIDSYSTVELPTDII